VSVNKPLASVTAQLKKLEVEEEKAEQASAPTQNSKKSSFSEDFEKQI